MKDVDIITLITHELAAIAQPDLLAMARQLAITPRLELREWDYGSAGQQYPCWLVMEHQATNIAIAYCAEGFGPSYPWGLLFLSGENLSMGMDSDWFSTLEDALRNSPAWDGPNPPGYQIQ